MANWLVVVAFFLAGLAMIISSAPPPPAPQECEEITIPNESQYLCPDPEHIPMAPISVHGGLVLCRCVEGYRRDETSL